MTNTPKRTSKKTSAPTGVKRKAPPQKPVKKGLAESTSVKDLPRPAVEDIIATKMLRDNAIKEKVYLNHKIAMVLAGCLCLSIVANVSLFMKPAEVTYFATNGEGKLLELLPLKQPVQSVNEVLSWSTKAITDAYTFDFVNYRAQLQESRDLFTAEGWKGFQNALNDSGNLRSVVENKFVTTVVPRGAPVVVAEGYRNGSYAWKIEVPIMVTYQSSERRTNQSLLVEAVIVRRSELEHPRGIGIAQIIAQ